MTELKLICGKEYSYGSLQYDMHGLVDVQSVDSIDYGDGEPQENSPRRIVGGSSRSDPCRYADEPAPSPMTTRTRFVFGPDGNLYPGARVDVFAMVFAAVASGLILPPASAP